MASGQAFKVARIIAIDGQDEVVQSYKYKNKHGVLVDGVKILTDKDRVGTAVGRRIMSLIEDELIDFPASAAVDIKIEDLSAQATGWLPGDGNLTFTLSKAATLGMIRVYLNGQNVTPVITLSEGGLSFAFDADYHDFAFDGSNILADYVMAS